MLVRACGFESHSRHQQPETIRGDVAKWLRQGFAKPLFGGSIPPVASNIQARRRIQLLQPRHRIANLLAFPLNRRNQLSRRPRILLNATVGINSLQVVVARLDLFARDCPAAFAVRSRQRLQ